MDHSSVRFGQLHIQGFRRLQDVKLQLRPLSVMIGANGTGKTSVLDVLSLLASSAQGRLSSSISELSGLANVLTYDRAEELALGIAMEVPGQQPLEYQLRLRPQGLAHVIREETLSQIRKAHPAPFRHIISHEQDVKYYDPVKKGLMHPTWEHDPLETSLSQIPKMLQEPEDFRRRLASLSSYHVWNVEPQSTVRLPQALGPTEIPGRNGEDLASCLFYLQQTERNRFDAIEDSLRAAFPRFERLDFPPVAAGTLALALWWRGISKPLSTDQLSLGTLRFLWLTTLLQSPGLTSLTLLDEPEVCLQLELVSLLADQLREASQRTQIIVATHSDNLIRFLEPSEVVILDSTEDGMTSLTRADELDLDDWLKDYTLDELWRNGRLGARA